MKSTLAFIALFAITALIAWFEPLGYTLDLLTIQATREATIYTLLMMPIGVLAIVFFRLVIGLETFGLFAPLILAFTFYKVSPPVGVAVFIALLALVSPVGIWLARFPLLSTARTGSLVVLCSLLLIVFMAFISKLASQLKVIDLGLPVVALSGMMDRFVSAQLDQSPREAFKLSINTLLVSVTVSVGVIGNHWLREFIHTQPDLLLFSLPACLLLGRYSGLRLNEYWRFRVMGGKS